MVGPSLLRDITRAGDPDLTFITTWCFDLPGVIGVTWLFTEIQFTEHSTTPNIYLAIVCIHELEEEFGV